MYFLKSYSGIQQCSVFQKRQPEIAIYKSTILQCADIFADYPTPIVNRRTRDPVYSSFSDTTVLKVFTDFRNWSYRMLRVHGSTLDLQDDESRLVIPLWAKSDVSAFRE